MTTMRAIGRHRKEVFSGLYIDYDDPQPSQISLADIAHGLAYTCRFGGHTSRFYSVAEHAVLVSSLILETHPQHYALALHGLHHDDHEAYLGDLPTPLKNALGTKYDELRTEIDEAICKHLNLHADGLDALVVHRADALALRMEAHVFLPSRGRDPEWQPAWEKWGIAAAPDLVGPRGAWDPGLSPYMAERAYLDAHAKLLSLLGD